MFQYPHDPEHRSRPPVGKRWRFRARPYCRRNPKTAAEQALFTAAQDKRERRAARKERERAGTLEGIKIAYLQVLNGHRLLHNLPRPS